MSETILNTQQQKAVHHGNGPLLIIAGAGTGKTTVITQRITSLITEKNIQPSEILALTFTEKAALEMETRVDQALPYGYSQLWIQTFHGFCDRILRNEAIHIGLDPRYHLLTEAEALLFLKKNVFEFDLSYFRPLGNPMKFLQGMLQHFSRLRDDDISPDDYLSYAKKLEKENNTDSIEVEKTYELANAFKTYEMLKAKNSMMDFSDLIANTLKLFRTRPNVLKEYQQKFSYILVDEFQDTNFAQNEMAILLSGDKKNITVVGDDDQSIYRWRGAALANMLQFRSHFPNATVVSLTQNYRSTQTILDRSYELIQHNNPYRLEVKEQIEKKLTSGRAIAGETVEFLFGNKVEDEAEQVVMKIKEEMKKNNRSYRDFAILVRANDHSLPFQRELERKKIPFQFLGPGRLFQQEVIKDLIAYLRILSNYEDTASLYRVITNPIFSFEARDIAAMMNAAKKKNKTLFEILENPDDISIDDEAKERVKRFIEMMHTHLEMVPRDPAGQILYAFFEDSGLLGYYLDPDSPRTEEEALNIAKFFQRLASYSSEHEDVSVFAVVDWIELSMELGESPLAADVDWSENNAVNILTVHSSKGLEFPVVFVVNLVTQRFPSRDRKEQIPVPQDLIKEQLPEGDENLQEERRLFYVAMTRAKDKLFLTSAKFYGEGKKERKLSPFISEALGDEYVQSLLNKQKQEASAEQLSLLGTLKPRVAEKDSPKYNQTNHSPIDISFISYSQLQTFSICPLHYKLQYIMKLPTTKTSALSFGMSIHAALSHLYDRGFGKNIIKENEVEKIVRNTWISEGYSSKKHEEEGIKKAKSLLMEYMNQNENEAHLPKLTEYPFQFYIKGLKVVGRFDRVNDLGEGKIEIVDYKTGDSMPTEKKLKSDLQLTLYALAATELRDPHVHAQPEDITLTLYYIEHNKKLTTTRTREQLDMAKDEILQKVEEIKTSSFRCSGSILCQNCEFKMLCSRFH